MNPFACCSFVESSIGFLSGLVSSAELVLLARQHRDRMLAKVTYPLIPELFHTLQAELPNLHVGQGVSVLYNLPSSRGAWMSEQTCLVRQLPQLGL